MVAEARKSTIRNSASTLASGLASSTNTRPSWANPGESCPSLSTHNAASSQVVCGSAPQSNAIGTGNMPSRSTSPDGEKMCRLAVPAAACGAAWRCGQTEADDPPHKLCRTTQKTVRRGLGRKADFSYWQCYEGQIVLIKCPDRVS